jgi:triosephosphate isomerase
MKAPLVVGNWKMNGTLAEAASLTGTIAEDIIRSPTKATVVLAPPATALVQVQKQIGASGILLSGQNCHWDDCGAFTGEISPLMLRDAGCTYVIVGHSERRHIFHENDELITKKLAGAMRNQLRPILCVGETLGERESGLTIEVITRQLDIALKGLEKNGISNVEVAYEPVWAIGTGRNANPEQITEVHACIRHLLTTFFGEDHGKDVRILYGGSVKPENARELAKTAEVNGLLVGGASLKAETFLPVIRSFDVSE